MNTPNESTVLCRATRNWRRGIWISLGVVIVPPMLGLMVTLTQVLGTFAELETTGQADPQRLAGHISHTLLATFYGLGMSVLGVVALVICILSHRRAKRALAECS